MADLNAVLSDESVDDLFPDDTDEGADAPEDAPEGEVTDPVDAEDTEAKAPEEAPEEEPEKHDEGVTTVPLSALQAVRAELQALKAQVKPQVSEPVKPIDFYDDPDGALAQRVAPLQQQLVAQKLDTSRFMAEREFGAELVGKAVEFYNDPSRHAESHQHINTPSPFHAAVDAYQRHQAAQEIGSDPAAYEAKVRAKILAEMKAENVAQKPKVAAPASMANDPNLGSRAAPEWGGPPSLDEILGG